MSWNSIGPQLVYKTFKEILIILLGSIVASEEVDVFVYVFCHFLIKLFSVYV